MLESSVLIAAIGGIVTVLLAVLGIFGTVITAKLTKADYDRKIMATDQKAEAAKTDNKLTAIHEITNSNLSKANARLDEAMAEMKGLRDLIAEMKTPTVAPLGSPAPAAGSVAAVGVASAMDVIESAKETVVAAEKTVIAAAP